ncbi:methyltransferase [Neiella marina]|uniref:tRNA1(Val) (adenine(37)-N6)-methyltransferase n=1 Tax=Neiella holothuriorum TaxID=2870530 RepID=A0ABS7EJ37_9GAMM|nr:methyltransferase [Neiella holothuriorum]MBW8192346.1 methyltransferase [Neiella holothuriorum]
MSGFQCKAFYVGHDRCGMKVGTDSLLLGSWVSLSETRQVLDIGTGSGILALMMAQRLTEQGTANAIVDAVELDTAAAQQAADNFAASPWTDRLTAIQADILQWSSQTRYDLVISNPPYFVAGQQLACEQRQQARLESSLTLAMVLTRAEGLCSQQGRIGLVLPLERLVDVSAWADNNGWYVARTLSIRGRQNKPVKRVLIELTRESIAPDHQTLTIHDADNQYSEAFQALTRRFYLAF